jgi:hypothetical protein
MITAKVNSSGLSQEYKEYSRNKVASVDILLPVELLLQKVSISECEMYCLYRYQNVQNMSKHIAFNQKNALIVK